MVMVDAVTPGAELGTTDPLGAVVAGSVVALAADLELLPHDAATKALASTITVARALIDVTSLIPPTLLTQCHSDSAGDAATPSLFH